LIGAGAAAMSLAANRTPVLAQAKDTFAYRDVRALVAALAERQVSALELTNASIARIEALDGKLNAVVVRDFEKARAAAAQADAALARGERKPLLGVPMTVKESFNVAGLPTTWGVPAAKGQLVAEDALAVTRLKAAGAIVLGKTNVPLMLADWQSYNDIYGTTNNPWNVARTPGGSSGGAATALAAGFVPLELGSDIGGSLRVPANFCGVFAHKPTQGLIPVRGSVPPGAPALPVDVDLSVVGPLARNAADLGVALDVLAGPDEPLATAYKLSLPPARHERISDYRVLVLDTHPLLPTSGAVRTAIAQLADNLIKAGAKVARSTPLLPDLELQARTYQTLLTGFLGAGMPIEVYRGMQQRAAGLSPSDMSFDAVGARGWVISHRDWIWADRARNGLAARWRALFREFDVVICPVMPTVAFPHDHGEPNKRRIEIDGVPHVYHHQTVWPGVATLTGLPATAVPIGRSAEDLPIGAQIVGPYLEDRTTIALAGLIERAFGGFVPPPGYAG
jgi:amidase